MDKVKPRTGVGFSQFNYDWLRKREMGGNPKLGTQNKLMKGLYSNIMPCSTWDYNDSIEHSMPGGVFNLEFSPDGSLLVAACEKRSILMFDPLSRKMIHAVDNAHFDCVNCVRFLDSRVFATCSDDSTVALWDARNLRSRIRTLQGHSNWVKNIEFSQSDGLLVTSGFDGSIYTWDINSYTESGFLYKRVFHTNGLMRTRLNPDGSKMIICTTGGYMIIIHDLNLHTLREDLDGFKPNMYRLMQLSQTTIPVAANFTHLFSEKRRSNRIEFITDFPDGDDAEVVSSLQVHPQGWCALSRNISNDENSEWTCIHDIQEPEPKLASEEMSDDDDSDDDSDDHNWHREGAFVINSESRARLVNPNLVDARSRTQRQRARRTARMSASGHWPRATGGAGRSPSGSSAFRGFPDPPARESNIVVTSTDVWEALVAIREARSRRERNRLQIRRLGGSGILMPDQEPQTRFRIVRMSSGLNLVNPEPAAAPAPDSDESPERQEGGGDPITLDVTGSNLASILIRYRLDPNGEGTSAGLHPEPEPFRGWNRPNRPTPPTSADQARPGTSGARTFVIVGSNANRNRLRQRTSTSAPEHSTPSTSAAAAAAATPSTSRVKGPRNHRIHHNLPRLSHYIQEPNVGRGFIKELCFSSDGRLICSPFGYGVRLLAFSKDCSELSACWPRAKPAVLLHELGTNVCHADIVVSTKFSPRHCLLVSGCLTGRIVWHQPIV